MISIIIGRRMVRQRDFDIVVVLDVNLAMEVTKGEGERYSGSKIEKMSGEKKTLDFLSLKNYVGNLSIESKVVPY